ncbi:THUMP domain-containing class I SAM-dependent RNA methyltransferase [Zongyangia hominis]|uniref:Class I SAM-dependent RNA methyltransferase n=1 Tax=Zongyangia hominis TaxID=2763677 RepID=A0A926E8F3_9FIRM|nr:class I SAM-dependent RNA methyltransferase [Zongyangia hominis]MBC8569795.1 class I SAM-dependent RNA methyltransferase [Zongyangia hominis]
MKMKLSCPCMFGLEGVLGDEARRLELENVQVVDGRVSFDGGFAELAKANIHLRTAERVQIILAEFPAYSFEDLFQGVKAIPWEDFVGKKDSFPVKGWSLNSKLHSVPDCQSIVKKAVVTRLSDVYHQSWFEETGPLHQIQFSIMKDRVTIMLDTSGPGLHKRGYRRNANLAPIKETLAAGIVLLSRLRKDANVIDPFCGSGTFLIESAMVAMNIAPGINRRFDCERWGAIPQEIWKQTRQEALSAIDKQAGYHGYGFDIDDAAVELSRENAKKAGVSPRIRVEKRDIGSFSTDFESAVIYCNPPYGERMLEVSAAREIYRTMGQVFEHRKYLKYYIISPDEEFEQLFGRRADKRRKLYNGMLKCQLYMYFK